MSSHGIDLDISEFDDLDVPQPRDQTGELFKFKRVFEVVSKCHRDAGENKSWQCICYLLASLSINGATC